MIFLSITRCPSEEEINQALERFYTGLSNEDTISANRRISEILKEVNRHLLHVYCLERDKNVVEIIFKAIFTGILFISSLMIRLIFFFFLKNSKKSSK